MDSALKSLASLDVRPSRRSRFLEDGAKQTVTGNPAITVRAFGQG